MYKKLLNQQGVTTIMDARVGEPQLRAFNTLREAGELTVRVENAVEIPPDDVADIAAIPSCCTTSNNTILSLASISQGAQPSVAIRHIKLFLDGVLQAPIMTARLHALIVLMSVRMKRLIGKIQSMLAISIFHLKS